MNRKPLLLERPKAGLKADLSSARRGHGLGFWTVTGVFTATMAFATVPTPLYAVYQRDLGFGPFVVTLVFAAFALGVVTSLFLAGHLSDQFGRRRVIAPAVALNVLSALVFMVWPAVPGLFMARFLSGIGVGMITATATAHLTELNSAARPGTGHRRAEVVATAANIGGLGLGPLVSGLLADLAPAPLFTPYVIFAFVLVVGLLLIVTVPETATGSDQWAYRPQKIAVPRAGRSRFLAASLLALVGFAMFAFFTSLAPQFISGQLGIHSFAASGSIAFAVFAASALAQMVSARLRPRTQQTTGLALLAVGLVLVTAAIVSASLPFLVVGGVVAGAGAGVAFKLAVASVVRLAPEETRGEALAGLFLSAYIGMSLPVILLGIVLQIMPPAPSALLFGCLMLLLLALAAVTAVRARLTEA
ncbi:MFS transporter [Sinomonas susongensis]|uniref:MFS transporter n=1 Tax=Sinomonas susongensis TaxID=1324851 RepID=UPI0011089943|nr:MFS transporter [Sinomonas susongensis]